MAIKILKYTLIVAGCLLVIGGFIRDYDGFTMLGVFLIIAPLILPDFIIKIYNRNKIH
jgi:UPF0716 family protein affecting phage T7 exclusion